MQQTDPQIWIQTRSVTSRMDPLRKVTPAPTESGPDRLTDRSQGMGDNVHQAQRVNPCPSRGVADEAASEHSVPGVVRLAPLALRLRLPGGHIGLARQLWCEGDSVVVSAGSMASRQDTNKSERNRQRRPPSQSECTHLAQGAEVNDLVSGSNCH